MPMRPWSKAPHQGSPDALPVRRDRTSHAASEPPEASGIRRYVFDQK